MSMAPDRQYLAVALKQGETVASKSRAKIVGAAGKTNGRVFASKFVIAATIMSLSAIWSFAICNLLVANLVLTHLVGSRTGNRDSRAHARRYHSRSPTQSESPGAL